jgi:diphthamide synthase (EF-2-diphthine--ammonia ligase)
MTAVIASAATNGLNQKWKVIYMDKAAKTETKGLNEEFGFHINRPFYLVS